MPRASASAPASRGATSPEVDDLVTSLLTASRVLIGVSVASLAEIEDTVTMTQFRALVVVHSRNEPNLNALAADLGVNASTAMRTVDKLLAAGLATRKENPANRREVQIGLTPAGVRLVQRVTGRRRARIARIVETMNDADRAGMVEALSAFAEAAGEPSAAGSGPRIGW